MAEKRRRITSPAGIAKFPHLVKPNTKFNKEGEFSVKLLLPAGAHETHEFIQMLDALVDEAFNNAVDKAKPVDKKRFTKQYPYTDDCDKDGNPTGFIAINFKNPAIIKSKSGQEWAFKPALFDAKGHPITDPKIAIWGGSKLRVNFTPSFYSIAATKQAGVTLRLNAVQVIELVTGGGGSADSFGFGQEEGFDVKELNVPDEAPTPGEGETNEGDF